MTQLSTPPAAPPRDSLKNLHIHGMRGVLSFMVFIFHIANSGLQTFDAGLFKAINYGLVSMGHAVELFFGISGIVIFFAFRAARDPLTFLVNRMIRIYPVLWLSTLIVFVLLVLKGEYRPHLLETLGVIGANFLAIPPLLPVKLLHPAAWSLSYEFTFYLSFIAFGVFARAVPRPAAFVLILIPAAAFLSYHPRGWMFLSGLACAILAGNSGLPRKLRLPRVAFPELWLLAALLCWHRVYLDADTIDPSIWEIAQDGESLGFFIFAFICGSLGLAGIFQGTGRFAKLLLLPVFQWLGTISYSLYLWQVITTAVSKKLLYSMGLPDILGDWSQLALLTMALPSTLLVSHFSQVLIEARFGRILHRRWDKMTNNTLMTPEAGAIQTTQPIK